MALKTITGKATKSDGTIVPGGLIRITLSQACIIPGTQEVAPASVDVVPDPVTGAYSIQLQANNDLTPNGTYYSRSLYRGKDLISLATFIVPQTAGPFVMSNLDGPATPVNIPANAHTATLLVDGPVTFSAGPVSIPAASLPESAVANLASDLASKALDSGVAHKALPDVITGAWAHQGNETHAGIETFIVAPVFAAGFAVNAGQLGVFGSGDNNSYTQTTTPQLLDIRSGTTAAPDTNPNPLVKINRTIKLLTSQISGDAEDSASALHISVTNTVDSQVQVIGIESYATSKSTDATPNADAFAFAGVGRVLANGTHAGGGGFFYGRTDGTTASRNVGAEIGSYNGRGLDDASSVTVVTATKVLHLHADGPYLTGDGIQFSNPFGQQMDVGINFNGQVIGGLTGPTKTNDIKSSSNSLTAILLGGTHTAGALVVPAGSGHLAVGIAHSSTVLVGLQAEAANVIPLLVKGFTGQSVDLFQVLTSVAAAPLRVNSTGVTVISSAIVANNSQAPSEATLVSGVSLTSGPAVKVTLTAARLVGVPINVTTGQRLIITLVQGGAGAFAVTWNAIFKGITGGTSGATGTQATFSFIYDGTNWNLDGAQPSWV